MSTSTELARARLGTLRQLVRRRFPAADGLICSHDADDTVLWQVVAGTDVIWDAGPDVTHTIPRGGATFPPRSLPCTST